MALRPPAKRLIAGLAVASLMFQAALVAVQLSILIAARPDPAAASPIDVICTDHGLAAAPSDDADKVAACGLCPFCLSSAAGQPAILTGAGFSLLEAPAKDIAFRFNADRGADDHSAQPRSRGPPAFA